LKPSSIAHRNAFDHGNKSCIINYVITKGTDLTNNLESPQKLPAGYREKTLQDDLQFGTSLSDSGHITAYQLERARAIQQRYVQSGKLVRLCQILIKRDMISFDHAEVAFEAIGEPRRFCRTCGSRYRPDITRQTCPQCNSPYPTTEPEEFELVAVTGAGLEIARAPKETRKKQGKKFGRYFLQNRIGKGGMGAVYEAYDPEADEFIALKILHPMLAGEGNFRDRFLVEVAAMRNIEHPNAVQFLESGIIDGHLYCSMELLSGSDLSQRLSEEGQLSVNEVLTVLWEIAQVLDYGHTELAPGIFVHRDVKPANIFACDDGSYRLMDFGLVRSRVLFEKSITEQGHIFGTIPYMSPEQIIGRKGIDIRSDIFSLGSTAYHLLSGEFPFPGNNIKEVQIAVCKGAATPIRHLVPEVPKVLADCLKKMMTVKLKRRFQTPAEFLDVLENIMPEE